jgi:hypothetical protein
MATTPRKSAEPQAGHPADGVTANGPEVAPIDPRYLQPGQAVTGILSTNPPRGVDELPADHITDEPSMAAVQKAVHERVAKETEQGFRGARGAKPVPNSAYTLAGVNAGTPTPETVVHTPTSK